MSGGHFGYNQRRIHNIIYDLEELIKNQGKEIPEDERFGSKQYYEDYPEEKYHQRYPDDINQEFMNGLYYLKKAYIYAQRIDWYLSDDDGEDSFLERLKHELDELEKNK